MQAWTLPAFPAMAEDFRAAGNAMPAAPSAVNEEWADRVREVRAAAAELVAAGRHAALAQWIETIPLEVRARDPWLGYWLGRCRLALGIAGARTLLAAAFSDFERAGDAAGARASCDCLLASGVSAEQRARWTEAAERIAAGTPDGRA